MNDRLIPDKWLPNYTYADYEAWGGDSELIEGIPYATSPSAERVHQSTARKYVRLAEDALLKKMKAIVIAKFFMSLTGLLMTQQLYGLIL